MPVKTEAIGKSYPPATYAVGREKVREYAHAVGEEDPLHHDLDAARAAGFADVVAPPMFAVVYSAAVMAPAIFDPEIGINFATMEITTTATVKDISERNGMGFYVFETVSENQDGETVCTATWTNIVRGV
jgi:acyl dehydratase